MGHVRLSEHIDAPIDHVWEINASCERLPEWNVNIVEVRDCPGRARRTPSGCHASTKWQGSGDSGLSRCNRCSHVVRRAASHPRFLLHGQRLPETGPPG